MVAKKKQILTASLVIALVAAVAVNWYYSGPQASPAESAGETEEVMLGDSLLVAGKVSQSQNEGVGSEESGSAQSEEKDSSAYFDEARLKKTQSHDEIKNEISSLMNNPNASVDDKTKLTAMLEDFQKSVKAEADCESLITAKAGDDCIVIINGGSAQVILKNNSINDTLLLQITDIIEKNTNISAENLTIIEAK